MPALVSGVLTGLGMLERDRERFGPLGMLAVGVLTVLVVVWLAASHEPDVPDSEFAQGLVLGTVGIGFLPAVGYYALGRGLGERRVVLAVIWLGTQVPLAFYLFAALVITLGMTHCGPDAYECPL